MRFIVHEACVGMIIPMPYCWVGQISRCITWLVGPRASMNV